MEEEGSSSHRRRHARLKSLFLAALSNGRTYRSRYLARLRDEDATLAVDVERLLVQHDQAGDLLEAGSGNAAHAFTPSQLVANRFRVVRLLGRGGMGEVYEAIDLVLRQPVALKTIRPDVADAAARERFLTELELARRVSHPNVCRTNELWQEESPEGTTVFLTMELLEGESLAELLKRGGRLDPARALPLLEQLAAALGAIHRLNIIHRDLKPSNVHIVPGGAGHARLVVTDFGLARKTALIGSPTYTTALAGTPAYMAPEQFEANECSVASDVYAFGVIAFELLTGQRQPIVPARSIVPELDLRWEKFLLRCVAQEARKRPADSEALLTELRALRDAARWTRTRRVARRLSFALVPIALASGGTWLLSSSGTRNSPEFTRVTLDQGLTCELSASADGRSIVYSSDRAGDGLFQVWLQRLPDGELTRLTEGPWHAMHPAISPDGRQLVFRWQRDGGGLYLRPLTGGVPRLIAPYGRHPRFSPDGRHIVYWTGVEGDHALSSGRLWIVPTAGGSPRQLLPEMVDARFPLWSPDGRYILFRGSNTPGPTWDEHSDWWVTDPEGRRAAPSGAFARLAEGRLSLHDGGMFWERGRLVFAARAGHSTNLWSLPVSDAGRILGKPERVTSGSNLETSPWPLENGFLTYTNWEASAQIWRVWTDGNRSGETEAITTTDALDTRPGVSADGARLMFTRRLGEVRNLWIKDLPNGKESQIVPGTPLIPALSPDGQQVAYTVRDALKRPILLTRAGGGPSQRLCDDCGEVQGWSARGNAVLYLRQGVEEQTLEMFSVPARQSRVLVRAAGLSEGILSPDEQQVAFSVRSDGVHSRIHLAPIQSAGTPSSWRAMTPAAGWADKPRWSPDGKSLFFYSERDGFGCIWRQAMERGQPVGEPVIAKHLHQAQHAIFHLSRQAFSLSAGPDFVVYNEPTVRGNLWMMSQGETVGGRPDWLGWIRSVPPFSLEVLAWEN